MSIEKKLLGGLNVPFNGIIDFNNATGEITPGDNQPLEPELNLTTGKLEFKDKNGITVYSFTFPNNAIGNASKVAFLGSVDFAAINALGAVPSGNIPFDLKVPADFFITGIVGIITTSFLINIPY